MLLFSHTNVLAAAALHVMLTAKVVFASVMIAGLNYIFSVSSFILKKFCLVAAYSECFVILLPLGIFVDQMMVCLENGHFVMNNSLS